MEMVRTFHPIGQGGFYTEKFSEDGKRTYTVAYDVGSKTLSVLKKEIKAVGKVDVVVLSHLHDDHVNGIETLYKNNKGLKIVIPILNSEEMLETALYNALFSKKIFYDKNTLCSIYKKIQKQNIVEVAKSSLSVPEIFEDIENVNGAIQDTILQYKNWNYILYNPDSRYGNRIINAITKSNDVEIQAIWDKNKKTIDESALNKVLTTKSKIAILKKIYEAVCRTGNNYSMSLYSGPAEDSVISNYVKISGLVSYPWLFPIIGIRSLQRNLIQLCKAEIGHCLYLGDLEVADTTICAKLINFYGTTYWDKISMIQEPHHGSENGYNPLLQKMYDQQTPMTRLFVISVGLTNTYGHPSVQVINNIYANEGLLSIQTEKSTPLVFKYEFNC